MKCKAFTNTLKNQSRRVSKKLTTLCLFVIVGAAGWGQTTFQRYYGSNSSDGGGSIFKAANDGYVIASATNGFGQGNYDFELIRVDSIGNLIWAKTYGGSNLDSPRACSKTSDGGYLLSGYTRSWGTNLECLALKVDATGNLQWSKYYSGNGDDVFESAPMEANNGYVFSGNTNSYGGAGKHFYMIKTDLNGAPQFSKTYKVNSIDNFSSGGLMDSNDNLLMCGRTESNFPNMKAAIMKADSLGNAIWMKNYSTTARGDFRTMFETSDGGYLLTGINNSIGAGLEDIFVVKTDTAGNVLWAKTYGGADVDEGTSSIELQSGGYLTIGSTKSFGFGDRDIVLMRIDALGNLIWAKAYGGALTDLPAVKNALIIENDGFAIIGGTASFGNGTDDIYFIKTDTSGNSGCNEMAFTPTVMSHNITPVSLAITPGSGAVANVITPTSTNPAILYDTLCFESEPCVLPTAGFSFSANGTTIQFTDTSSSAVSWEWDFGDLSQSTAQNPLHVYPDTGWYYVCLIITDSCGSDTVCDSIYVSESVGINQLANGYNQITIYPNPTSGVATITNGEQGITNIEVFDLFGRLVLTTTKPQVDLSNHAKGIYFVKLGDAVSLPGFYWTGKLVVQ